MSRGKLGRKPRFRKNFIFFEQIHLNKKISTKIFYIDSRQSSFISIFNKLSISTQPAPESKCSSFLSENVHGKKVKFPITSALAVASEISEILN